MNSLIQCSHADFGYENQDAVVDVTMEVNPVITSASSERTVPERAP